MTNLTAGKENFANTIERTRQKIKTTNGGGKNVASGAKKKNGDGNGVKMNGKCHGNLSQRFAILLHGSAVTYKLAILFKIEY